MPDTLWCLLEGELDAFPVSTSCTTFIYDLKIHIKKLKGNTLQRADASNLKLWKVNVDLDGIILDIKNGKYEFDTRGLPLSNAAKVSSVWEQPQPSDSDDTNNHLQLHVYITLPADMGRPIFSDTSASLEKSRFKRRRLNSDPNPWADHSRPDDSVMAKLSQFWADLWRDKLDPFHEASVLRDPNPVDGVDVPATLKVLHFSKALSSIDDVMIRDDYDEALRDIEAYHTGDINSVIILGHPGIGKTILLYYILAKRLFEEKPTILQNAAQYLFFFNADGVKILSPSKLVDPESDDYHKTWALVDINPFVKRPADMLGNPNSTFFLVMASSPMASPLRKLQKYRRPAAYWLMTPFTLAELIQARQLQQIVPKESDIKHFFEKYGPSARDCYEICKANCLGSYEEEVRRKIKKMSWDLITEILTSHPADVQTNDGSHKVLLVEPRPDDRALPRTRIVTKTVGQLLWERDSGEMWRNHRKLFKTLLREASARSFCGKLFEPAFHALCIRGATFTIHPLARNVGPRYYTFVNDGSERGPEPKNLELNLQGPFFFDYDEKEQIKIASLDNHYYQPTASNYPSLDSFVYDRDSCQISAFQVTVPEKHDFSPKGVIALHELGQRLRINNLKIRVIVVVFEEAEVAFKVDRTLFHGLGLEVYKLKVTENQLNPDL